MKVGPPKITWSGDDAIADVSIPIEENRRYVVRDVEIVMEGGAARAEGFRAGGSVRGRALSPARRGAGRRRRARGALERGAHPGEDRPVGRRSTTRSATAAVKVVVTPGPQVMIAGAEVRGNARTRESFVLDRARLHAGEVLTGERLDRAVDELYGTGLFKSVRVEPVVPKGTESRPSDESYDAQVAIAVEELLARTIDFEVGWGSYELLRGSVRYRDRNLFGTGRDFEVEPAASVKSVGADVRFFDRYILGKKNTLEVLSGLLAREEPSYDLLDVPHRGRGAAGGSRNSSWAARVGASSGATPPTSRSTTTTSARPRSRRGRSRCSNTTAATTRSCRSAGSSSTRVEPP